MPDHLKLTKKGNEVRYRDNTHIYLNHGSLNSFSMLMDKAVLMYLVFICLDLDLDWTRSAMYTATA